MAWLTWRQHRLQLGVSSALLGALAIAALATALPMHEAYHRHTLAACLPPATRSGCDLIVRHFRSEFGDTAGLGRSLILVPALLGAFVGAPLVARELEFGTYRLVWTQAVSRRRWLASKTVLLAAATVLGAGLLAILVTWWRHPFDALDGRLGPNVFEIEGVVVPAYAVFALTLGVLAGTLLRRTIPAMTVTLALFFGARIVVGRFLRPHYLPAEHRREQGLALGAHARDWILSNSLVDAAGRRIGTGREDLAILHAQHARIDPQQYLLSLGWRRAVTFQPAGRFWSFQAIEAGIFLALALALALATVWLIRRRPA